MDLLALNEQVRAEAAKAIVGQNDALTQVLVAFLSGGHVLLEGAPGVAKTLIAKTLARLVDTGFGRIQFTADLMPSDVVGTQVFDLNKAEFYLRKGPIFTNIVLADEINRAPAKTQSALLEAMEERQVSIDGTQHGLGDPFMVLATQNPIEYEGTYPLPEAQLDRFLFKVVVGYPNEEQEKEILRRYHTGFDAHHLERSRIQPVLSAADLPALRAVIQAVTVEEGIMDYITQITKATRRSPHLILGGSPRATIATLLTAKTYAALQGRPYVTPDDVKAMLLPIYRHRLILRPEAEIEGLDADAVMRRIIAGVPAPR